MDRDGLVARIRQLLRSAIKLRYQGELHNHKVRAQAFADGYMRALEEAGLVDQPQLLRIVAEERQQAYAAAAEPSPLAAAG
jgi:hypothetical protein